jgi:hypothetical protein
LKPFPYEEQRITSLPREIDTTATPAGTGLARSHFEFMRPIGLIPGMTWQPPKKHTLWTAPHTLPSSVVAQTAFADLLATAHSPFTCCLKATVCLPNHGCIETFVAFEMSPDPAASTSTTMGDFGSCAGVSELDVGEDGEGGVVRQPTAPPKQSNNSKQHVCFIE